MTAVVTLFTDRQQSGSIVIRVPPQNTGQGAAGVRTVLQKSLLDRTEHLCVP